MALAAIKVGPTRDAGREDMYDFTPDDRKVFARTAQVRKGEVYVSVTETDRDDLSRVSLYVLVERGRRGFGEQTEHYDKGSS